MAMESVMDQTKGDSLHLKFTDYNSGTGQGQCIDVNKVCAKYVGGNSVNECVLETQTQYQLQPY